MDLSLLYVSPRDILGWRDTWLHTTLTLVLLDIWMILFFILSSWVVRFHKVDMHVLFSLMKST